MEWNKLTDESQINTLLDESSHKAVLIFKHSTRCSISSMALSRLERNWTINSEKIKPYILDLISFRNISNAIADQFKIEHQSPQVLVIKNKEVVYHASHMAISKEEILDILD